MSRITDLASSNVLLSHILDTRNRLKDLETQVSTEKVSQDYTGLARQSQHLINFENTRNLLEQYTRNNDLMDTRLKIAEEATAAIETAVADFRDTLMQFQQNSDYSEENVKDIQDWAFRSLRTIEGYLNTQADGRYLFSGARVTNQPANLGYSKLSDFQAAFDGDTLTFPTTRDSQLSNFSLDQDSAGNANWLYFEQDAGGSGVSRITAATAEFANVKPGTTITVSGTGANDGTYTVQSVGGGGTAIDVVTKMLTDEPNQTAVKLTSASGDNYNASAFGDLSFTRATSTITAATAGSLSAIEVGSTISIGNTTDNDGDYTVVSNDGTNIVVASRSLSDEGAAGTEVAGTISTTSYYSGDTTAMTHRVDDDRSFSYDLTAVDPAFEKAIRAMSIIAQGEFGTAGGLDQNTERVGDAMYLLDSALDSTTTGTPPFGAEQSGNLETVLKDLSFDRVLINQMNTSHGNFINYLENQIGKTENVDRLEAITKLLDDSRALEASYEALSRIRQLSLHNYLG